MTELGPINRIHAILQRCPMPPTMERVAEWIEQGRLAVATSRRRDQEKATHEALRQRIRAAALALLEAMPFINLDAETGLEDQVRLERDLRILKDQIPEAKPARGVKPMDAATLSVYRWAAAMLRECGEKPDTGPNGNVRRLGARLSEATGLAENAGEGSEHAARHALDTDEQWINYFRVKSCSIEAPN